MSGWCKARLVFPAATCERKAKHEPPHRAEIAQPVLVDGVLTAQVISWDGDGVTDIRAEEEKRKVAAS